MHALLFSVNINMFLCHMLIYGKMYQLITKHVVKTVVTYIQPHNCEWIIPRPAFKLYHSTINDLWRQSH